MSVAEPELIAQARGIGMRYRARSGGHDALSGVDFELRRGETLAVVGESGAGKSTLTRLVAGVERPTSGTIAVLGRRPRLRSGVVSPTQVVFQHPQLALSPFATVGESIAEPLRGRSKQERARRTAELLEQVGLDPRRAGDGPSRFSGGQLQRVVLARALAAEPALLICDEATSALDVSIQAQIVNLLLDLQRERRFACLLVTHDLGVAHVMADDILVLRRGVVAEQGPARDFFAAPRSDYGRSLLEVAHSHSTEAR